MDIKTGVSARHVHLTEEDVKLLFGEGTILTKKADLSQPFQYACNEQVTLQGPKGIIERVRILAPLRSKTQVELAMTDAFKLGINPPVRLSGDLEEASEITIIGPAGKITKNAAIIAARHIHATPEDAKKYNLFEDKEVSVEVSGIRGGVLDNIKVRIDNNFSFEFHVDTDEANALMIKNGDTVKLIIKE